MRNITFYYFWVVRFNPRTCFLMPITKVFCSSEISSAGQDHFSTPWAVFTKYLRLVFSFRAQKAASDECSPHSASSLGFVWTGKPHDFFVYVHIHYVLFAKSKYQDIKRTAPVQTFLKVLNSHPHASFNKDPVLMRRYFCNSSAI